MQSPNISEMINEDTFNVFETLFESSVDCLQIITLDSELYKMNLNGQALMEIDAFEKIKGSKWPDLWKGELRLKAVAQLEKAFNGENARFSGMCKTFKGSSKWWDVTLTPIKNNNKVVAVFSLSRDITEFIENQKMLEHSLEVQRQNMKEKKDLFKNINIEVDLFFNSIRNDINKMLKNELSKEEIINFSNRLTVTQQSILAFFK